MADEQNVLSLASFLLGYPESRMWECLSEAEALAGQIESSKASVAMHEGIAAMQKMGQRALENHYVSVFDFSEKTCLYMTAHEFGDNRARGNAFINLRILLASEGYEQLDSELPDYIPLLLEFLADCRNEEKKDQLKPRMAKVVARIRNHIDQTSPYALVFAAVAEILPVPDNIEFPDREKADTGKMPYPLPFE